MLGIRGVSRPGKPLMAHMCLFLGSLVVWDRPTGAIQGLTLSETMLGELL